MTTHRAMTCLTAGLLSLCVTLSGACGTVNGEEGDHDEHGEEGDHDDGEEGEHDEATDTVRVSKAALERAGIRVAPVEVAPVVGGIMVPAEVHLNPDRTAHVSPIVSGQIKAVHAALGDIVKAGASLATITSVALGETRTALAGARAAVEVAKANLKRQEELAREGVGAKRALLEAKGELRMAEAELRSIAGRLRVYGGAGGGGSVVTLRSPLDGVVIERHATPGEIVSADRPLFVVADLAQVWVVGRVYEQDVAAARVGVPAMVTLRAYPAESWPGTISWVAATLDEGTRTLGVRIELENTDGRLHPGLFGEIALSPSADAGRPVPVVPEVAIQRLKGLEVVFIPGAEEGEFHAVPVRTGARFGGKVEITEGLEGGQPVVVAGAFTLKAELLKGELGEGHAH